MADEEIKSEELEEFSNWYDQTQEAEVVEEDDSESEVMKIRKKVDEMEVDRRIDQFQARASDDAKRIFALIHKGDEDLHTTRGQMQYAITKADEVAKELAKEQEEMEAKAEQLADQKAKEEYGVGPIGSGTPEAVSAEQTRYNQTFERVQQHGDPNALLELMAEDSPFIDAVLTGKPLEKKK